MQEAILQFRKKMRNRRAHPVMAFLDIKAAYPSVDRNLLWRKLLARGVPPSWVATLSALFDNN